MADKGTSVPVVEMRGITKRFLSNVANNAIDLVLARGEILALLGENGAGKTTLMNVLFGYYAADEGEIRINGEIKNLKSPKDAIDSGIGMIHQHFTLVPTHTVLENIIIGTPGGRRFFLNERGARSKLTDLMSGSACTWTWTRRCGCSRSVSSRRSRS